MTMATRRARKVRRAMRVLDFVDGFWRDEREYRVRFDHGSFYAEYRDRFFWHKLVESCGMDAWYSCKTRDRALELIAAEKARIIAWAAEPRVQMV